LGGQGPGQGAPGPVAPSHSRRVHPGFAAEPEDVLQRDDGEAGDRRRGLADEVAGEDRKSTRLNSSHGSNSYAVFCSKKKKHVAMLQPLRTGEVRESDLLGPIACARYRAIVSTTTYRKEAEYAAHDPTARAKQTCDAL